MQAQLPKVDDETLRAELEMTVYDQDSAASAVILKDFGEAAIEELSGSLILNNRIYRRIKIFNESAFDLSEVEIAFYPGNDQRVSNVKGETYFLEGGKVKSAKLSKKGIIHEKQEDGMEVVKFTLPQIREGAVFQYSYQMSNEHYSRIRPWFFQGYYPVVHSEYITRIPEWFRFLPLFKGGMPLSSKETEEHKRTINYMVRTQSRASATVTGQSQIRNESVQYQEMETTYIMEDIPAFVKEPFMTTPLDHIASLEFQLQTVRMPNRPIEPILGSWENLAQQYLKWSSFGERIKDGKIRKLVKELPLAGRSDDEKTVLIYEYVRGSMSWNGNYSDVVGEPLIQSWNQKTGSSGAINLILLTMLREAGLPAFPVITSTRGHGKIQQIYPLASQFNHVVVLTEMSAGEVLLDGTSDFTAFGMLPENVLNGQGFLIDNQDPGWVSLQAQHKQDATIMANLKMDSDGTLSGSYTHTGKGYDAAAMRYRLTKLEKDEKEYVETYLMDDWTDAEIESVVTKEIDDRNKPIEVSCKFSGTDYVNVAGDFIYLQPMLSVAQTENPFKLAERSYPVDMAAPIHEKYIFNLTLPEGYAVAEMPKSTRIALPNNGGTFLFQGQAMGNMLQLMSDVSINQQVFPPEEYTSIKTFFDYIVAKHAEQVVLQRSE